MCVLCAQSPEHKIHEIMEKLDYFQSSKYIIDKEFNKHPLLTGDQWKIKENNSISIYQAQFQSQFKRFHEMLDGIEQKYLRLFETYSFVNKASCSHWEDNWWLIKRYCAKGWDELKEEIQIKNMIVDDSVFITFHNKCKELYRIQSKRFENDVQKYKEWNETVSHSVIELAQKTCSEISKVWNERLMTKEEEGFTERIKNLTINEVEEKEVVDGIVKGARKSWKSNPLYVNNFPEDDNKTKNESRSGLPNIERELVEKYSKQCIPWQEQRHTFDQNNETKDNESSSWKNDYQGTDVYSEDWNKQVPTNQTQNQPVEYITRPIIGEAAIKIVFDNPKIAPRLNEPSNWYQIFGNSAYFYNDLAFCNHNKVLYIAGGYEFPSTKKASLIFLEYNPKNNKIQRWSNTLTPHVRHTMIGRDEYVYLIGGENTFSCERFSIVKKTWEVLPQWNYVHVKPCLCFIGEELYCFFGENNIKIEKLKVNNYGSSWIEVKYDNPDKLNLSIYGCGISVLNDDVFFFGGRTQWGITNKIFIYNASDQEFSSNDQVIDEPYEFTENTLFLLGNNFAQLSDSNTLVGLNFN